jgi:hypothetical protein
MYVQSISIDGNPCVINYLYDDQNRITSATQCDTVETYTYYSDSIVYLRTNGGTIAYKYIYTINASGIATGYKKIAFDGSVTFYTFTYDAGNDRIKQTDNTHLNTFINYTIANSNTVYDSSVSSVLGDGNYTISRTYYPNTINRIDNINFGKAFLGNYAANFKKSETYNTPEGIYTLKYTYVLDPNNGVSQRVTKLNDSIIESRSYQYY